MHSGSIGRYQKPDGSEEVRIHFPLWELDGKQIRNVTIFPHMCGTCIGGDHTHVEVDDTREPVSVIVKDGISLDGAQAQQIDRYLREKLAVNSVTSELFMLVSPYLA